MQRYLTGTLSKGAKRGEVDDQLAGHH